MVSAHALCRGPDAARVLAGALCSGRACVTSVLFPDGFMFAPQYKLHKKLTRYRDK